MGREGGAVVFICGRLVDVEDAELERYSFGRCWWWSLSLLVLLSSFCLNNLRLRLCFLPEVLAVAITVKKQEMDALQDMYGQYK